MKELQLREKDLEVQLRIQELELCKTAEPSTGSVDCDRRETTSDVSKHVKFVPSFAETEVDKYFQHLHAQSLKWPKEARTLFLHNSHVGKARAVYSALSVDESFQYDTVKMSILKACDLVPEAYRQRFINTQTYVCRVRERKGDIV